LDKIQRDTDRDFFMSGEEARTYGIIDKVIVEREVPKEETKKKGPSDTAKKGDE
jgi:ATP-dependent Clp protease protease subunit